MNIHPNRFFHLSLVFLVALNLVPHFNDYTVPTLAVGGLCLAWRLLYEYQYVPLPNFLTKLGLVLTLTYLVYQNYGQIFGVEAGSALLICAVSLKLIDRVGYRDAMVLLFLNFMLLLTRFFESQSLGITIFAFFDLIITTALLVQLHNGARFKFDPITLLKTGSKLVLQIAPFMILLFFVFPRFSTNFIKVNSGKTSLNGFSSTMEPGSVSALAKTSQMAFRVKFFGKPPQAIDMYWRGAVLSINQGMKWERGPIKKREAYSMKQSLKEGIHQEILLEPLFNDWTFALDRPTWIDIRDSGLQRDLRAVEGDVYALKEPYDRKYVYDAYSNDEFSSPLTQRERKIYSQTTKETDPRVLDLVASLVKETKNNEQIALRLMVFFQKQFRYTLEPGRLKTGGLAEFLFEKKLGFCEHFATSFASLMRLAGVPARVVVGFQGARRNRLSDYYMVTSRDAHAWTEIWSDDKQSWLRFDPTTMVSPLRFQLGGEVYHSLNEEQLSSGEKEDFLSSFDAGWLQQSLLAVDAIATSWNMFLLNYDKAGQEGFFARIGFKNVNQKLLLTVSLLILLCYFLWVRMRSRKNEVPESEAQKAYLLLRRKLLKAGLDKGFSEGPRDFFNRSIKELPTEKEKLQKFKEAYLRNEYGEEVSNFDFKKSVKEIQVSNKKA